MGRILNALPKGKLSINKKKGRREKQGTSFNLWQ